MTVIGSNGISRCNHQTLSLQGGCSDCSWDQPLFKILWTIKSGLIAKGAVEIVAECQEDFCCGYVAEAKAPESCCFPWCVYSLYWKCLTCEYIPEEEQRPSVTVLNSVWGRDVWLKLSVLRNLFWKLLIFKLKKEQRSSKVFSKHFREFCRRN